jgi:microcystin-dependent protein
VLIWKTMAYIFDDAGNLGPEFRRSLNATGTYEEAAAALPLDGSRLLCDGTLYNVADYPELGALLGSLYGGDGIITFGVPNVTDRVLLGRSGTRSGGSVGGVEEITLTSAMMEHRHAVGRFRTNSGSAATDLVVEEFGSVGPDGIGRSIDGENSSIATYSMSAQTGDYVFTSPPIANDGTSNLVPDPFSIMQPYISVWVYIRT